MKVIGYPFYPYLAFALFPIGFFALNTNVFYDVSLIRLLALMLAFCGLLIAALRLATRNRFTAAYLASLAPIIVFGLRPEPVIVPIFCAVAAAIGLAVRRFRLTRQAVVVANVVALALLVTPVSSIVRAKLFAAEVGAAPLSYGPIGAVPAEALKGATQPSVVHVVLDAYGGRSALEKIYGFDNGPFSDALAGLGFMVFEDVAVPYNHTVLAMSAVMNADFPHFEAAPLSDLGGNDVAVTLARTIVEGAAIRAFRDLGHQILFTTSGYAAFRYPSYARQIAKPEGMFKLSLFDGYFLLIQLDKWGISLFDDPTRAAPLDQRVRNALAPEVVDRLAAPFFLYSHILAPHPPFTISADGAPTSRWGFTLLNDGDRAVGDDENLVRLYRGGYLDKLQFVNREILAQVEKIIATVEGPLVIVIQGDHGGGSRHYLEDPDRSCLMERMQTTVAVYSNVPEIRAALERRPVGNTVNIYRAIFSGMLGKDLPFAEGQYFARWSALNRPISLAGADMAKNCP